MIHTNHNFGALIGSRICHDLISPVGAISNGLELMGLAGTQSGPEMDLVANSAAHANARLRFFRVAFGLSSDAQNVTAHEIRDILGNIYNSKVACLWQIDEPLPRRLVQAAFLALLCGEQAAPYGGVMTVNNSDDALVITVTGERLSPNEDHWLWLTGAGPGDLDNLPAAQVQFALLPYLLAELGRNAAVSTEGPVTLRI